MSNEKSTGNYRKGILLRLPIPLFFLLAAVLIAVLKIPEAFRSGVFQSWDIHSHVAVTERLRAQLTSGRITFFDPWWFGGWAAFSFYAPLAHFAAAVFSVFLGVFVDEPVQRAVQILTGLSLCFLPVSLYISTKRLCFPEGSADLTHRFFVAVLSLIFALWFLRHPAEGLGAGTRAGIQLGLFPQVLAWNLLLLYLGTLFPLVRNPNKKGTQAALSIILGALLLTHSLTFLTAFCIGVLSVLWFRAGFAVLCAHLLGVGLASFWLIPSVMSAGDFLPQDRMPSISSFFTILFPELADHPATIGERGRLSSLLFISGTTYLVLLGVYLIFRSRLAREHRILRPFTVFAVSLACLFSSDYLVLVTPVSLHLYRFLVLFLLLVLPPLATILALSAIRVHSPRILLFFLLLIVLQEWRLLGTSDVVSGSRKVVFPEEERVLEALAQRPAEGNGLDRVFFEHLGRPGAVDFPSPHYLAARLAKEAKRETANGLFIQSSLSQAFPAFAAKRLKIHAYNAPLGIGLSNFDTEEGFLRRLSDFGITDLILGPDGGREFGGESQKLGRYRRVSFGERRLPTVVRARKPLVAYINSGSSLKFSRLDAMVYGDGELWSAFEFIEVRDGQPVPPSVGQIIVGRSLGAEALDWKLPSERKKDAKVVYLPFDTSGVLAPIPEWQERDSSSKREEETVLRFLHANLTFPSSPGTVEDEVKGGEFAFSPDQQEILLSNLTPNQPVRINYSYLPFWSTDDGDLYRGLSERMWLVPRGDSAKIQYRAGRTAGALCGVIVTSLSLALLLRLLLLRDRRTPKRDYTSSDDIETNEN